MKISVLGSGCATCKRLYETVEYIVKSDKIDAEVEYSDDIRRIVELGLMRSPVLVVDGKPVNIDSISESDVRHALCNTICKSSKIETERSNCSCNGSC